MNCNSSWSKKCDILSSVVIAINEFIPNNLGFVYDNIKIDYLLEYCDEALHWISVSDLPLFSADTILEFIIIFQISFLIKIGMIEKMIY